jgi:K+/H+ antiporter YhaU regulatory subunit KhtT
MKKHYLIYCIALLLALLSTQANAQTFATAGEYMSFIGKHNQEITKDYLSYTSTVAHSKRARKIENRRKALLQSVNDASKKIAAMPPYNGDKSYRDSTAAFLKLTYHVLNDDYDKILNLEEVAEQSYDAMEAYLLAQDLAQEKSNQAQERLRLVQKAFAATHNVNLIESSGELEKKMELNNQISAYHRVVYLMFFKSFKQEMYLLDAFQKKDINAIEQNNNTLVKYTEESLARLDTMKAFRNDRSLVNACKQAQEFYKSETKETAALVDFMIKDEEFQKIKKAMDAKKPAERTQADVDQFNKAVNEMNKAANTYNSINARLNTNRNKSLENWNKIAQAFLDKHTPHYK